MEGIAVSATLVGEKVFGGGPGWAGLDYNRKSETHPWLVMYSLNSMYLFGPVFVVKIGVASK